MRKFEVNTDPPFISQKTISNKSSTFSRPLKQTNHRINPLKWNNKWAQIFWMCLSYLKKSLKGSLYSAIVNVLSTVDSSRHSHSLGKHQYSRRRKLSNVLLWTGSAEKCILATWNRVISISFRVHYILNIFPPPHLAIRQDFPQAKSVILPRRS